jgi:hypothetical protein
MRGKLTLKTALSRAGRNHVKSARSSCQSSNQQGSVLSHYTCTLMPHAVDGWYLGPAMEHYHCHRVWCWATKAERVCDTISWFPTKVQIPTASSADTIQACLEQIVVCLQNPAAGSPLAPLANTHIEALQTIQRLIVDPPAVSTEPKKNETPVETVDDADN